MCEIRKVLIVGAGIGGLGAGAALAQRGIEVESSRSSREPQRLRRRHQPARQLAAGAAARSACSTRSATLGFEFDRWNFHDANGRPRRRRAARTSGDDGVPSNCALARRELARHPDRRRRPRGRRTSRTARRSPSSTSAATAPSRRAVRRARRGDYRPRRRLRRHQLAAARAAVRPRPRAGLHRLRRLARDGPAAGAHHLRRALPGARARRPGTSRCRRRSCTCSSCTPSRTTRATTAAQFVEHAARAPRAVRGRGRRHPRGT